MGEIFDFFQMISDWLDNGIYDFFEEVYAQILTWVVVWYIKCKIFAVTFAWGVAYNVLVNIGLSAAITSAWSGVDSTLLSYLTFLRLPECINLLLQAVVTRFVLNFTGF